ncbi:MAG: hypothetical protein LBH50_02470 [Spirochaetaceae bacterium]|jgi:hypothetical protein|nr:hypothetical protein [Spirochaetaceae bacterium]
MLKFVTFLYDAFRFSALMFLLLPEIRANADSGYFAASLFCASSLALFPLMAFFMWFDSKIYRVFAYLYTAGKIAGICAAVAGIFSLRGDFMAELLLLDSKKFLAVLVAPCFAFLDVIFLIPVLLAFKSARSNAAL